jgi:ubiquinone biosynthesis protein COQ9
MQFEKMKARVRENPALSKLFAGPLSLLDRVRAPAGMAGMPGHREEGPKR